MAVDEHLAAWLPGQRWFAGKGAPVTDVAIAAETVLADGDPGLRHLIVAVSQDGQAVRYQILVGLRATIPERLLHAVIGPADGGLVAYDALHDPDLTHLILAAMAEGRTIGRLRFARESGVEIDSGLESLPSRATPACCSARKPS